MSVPRAHWANLLIHCSPRPRPREAHHPIREGRGLLCWLPACLPDPGARAQGPAGCPPPSPAPYTYRALLQPWPPEGQRGREEASVLSSDQALIQAHAFCRERRVCPEPRAGWLDSVRTPLARGPPDWQLWVGWLWNSGPGCTLHAGFPEPSPAGPGLVGEGHGTPGHSKTWSLPTLDCHSASDRRES